MRVQVFSRLSVVPVWALVLVLVLVLVAMGVVADPAVVSILDHGAIPGEDTVAASHANAQAIFQAAVAANATASPSQPATVLIPAGKSFSVLNVAPLLNLQDVVFQIDGTLLLCTDFDAWPKRTDISVTLAALYIGHSQRVTVLGTGTVDGRGYQWWWNTIITTVDNRPILLAMDHCVDVTIHSVYWKNSPYYHLNLRDQKNLVVRDLTIYVSVEEQANLLRQHGHWQALPAEAVEMRRQRWLSGTHGMLGDAAEYLPSEELLSGIPTYPLNTDGIDPSGVNILIENVIITSFDDAVAVKPLAGGSPIATCSESIIVRNCTVYFSVGMTIGSVPPNTGVNCVRNVSFSDIIMHEPFKAIYIKTNPGDKGSGLIDQISYRQFKAIGSLWYPIWIGPQQQDQPGGKSNTGCSFFYPVVPTCPTQPRVPVTRISLEDVTLTEGITLPGVLLCNSTVPCSEFSFRNVINTGIWGIMPDYVCENVQGSQSGNQPPPLCF